MKLRSLVLIFGSALTLSSLANIFLLKTGLHYYRLLSKVKLDPLGLSTLKPSAIKQHSDDSQLTLAFLGDSRALSWPRPSSSLPLKTINLGVSGQTTSQTLLRFQYISNTQHVPDIVVIQVGINDLKTIPLFPTQRDNIVANCKDNLASLVSLSVLSGSLVVISTIFPTGSISPLRALVWSKDVEDAIDECNNGIRMLSSNKVYVLETSNVLAGPNRRVLPQYQTNFLHINSSGYYHLNASLVSILDSISSLHSSAR
jgi:hypothetical protein